MFLFLETCAQIHPPCRLEERVRPGDDDHLLNALSVDSSQNSVLCKAQPLAPVPREDAVPPDRRRVELLVIRREPCRLAVNDRQKNFILRILGKFVENLIVEFLPVAPVRNPGRLVQDFEPAIGFRQKARQDAAVARFDVPESQIHDRPAEQMGFNSRATQDRTFTGRPPTRAPMSIGRVIDPAVQRHRSATGK